MNRGIKQFIYGVIYLAIITLIVWFVFQGLRPEQPVVDENKKEKEIYLSARVVKEPKFFQLASGESSFLVKVKNPNVGRSISFLYRFAVFNNQNEEFGEVVGDDNLSSDAEEYITDVGNFEETIRNVEFEVFDETYNRAPESLKDNAIVKGIKTMIKDNKATVFGLLENKSLLSLPKIKIIAVLTDKFGFQLYAGQTILTNISSFGSREFEIFIPIDEKIKKSINTTSTQVFVNVE